MFDRTTSALGQASQERVTLGELLHRDRLQEEGFTPEGFQQDLIRYAGYLGCDECGAEDLAQTAIELAVRKSQAFSSLSHLIGWLKNVMKFKRLNQRRKRSELPVEQDVVEHWIYLRQRHHEELEARIQLVRECLSELSAKDQAAIRDRFIEDIKPADAAAQSGEHANTISRRCSRARDRISRCITLKTERQNVK